jgi:Fic family protein
MYIHELPNWPRFRWDSQALTASLAAARYHQGQLIGRMEGLGFELRAEAVLQSLTEEVLKSSEIEGERLDREQVRSSIARRLGMDIGALLPVDRNVEGVVEMILDATQNYLTPLTEERLFGWERRLISNRPHRHDQNHSRHLADGRGRPDAGDFGTGRARACSFRSSGR